MGGVCPRCGLEYSYVETHRRRRRLYIVAVHYYGYERVGGRIKKKVKKCYLGPKDGYIYVTRTHGDLGLTFKGLADRDRLYSYMQELAAASKAGASREEARRLARLLEEIALILKRLK